MDNSKLEELMKKEITSQMQKEFFEVFKDSQLFLSVTFAENDIKKGFNINYLTDSDGKKAIALFTSSEIAESVDFKTSLYAVYMSDLAVMLKESGEYSIVAVNPFTDYDINIPVEVFLNLFEKPASQEVVDSINTILKMLDENSIELDDEYGFYLRGDEDIMKTRAVEGVYTPHIPLSVNSKCEFEDDLKYLDIILMPKGFKILFFGSEMGKNQYNTIIAPESQFKHIEDVDEYTSLWKCVAQPYYGDK